MPIIQIWGVPDFIPGKRLIPLKQQIKKDVAQIRALGLTEEQVSVFFPQDRVQEGLGAEIIILVIGLFDKPERTDGVRQILSQVLVDLCSGFFATLLSNEYLVECIPDEPYKESNGFASIRISSVQGGL